MQQVNIIVSIIIPVYNTEKYLRQCLDSAANQTFREIEIVCVDDGSTDASGAICDEYAAKDSRFVVLHTENQGQSAARNRGMDIAKGEYIAFLDSDDWLEVEMCSKCVEAIRQNQVDIVMFSSLVYDGRSESINYSYKGHSLITSIQSRLLVADKTGFVVYNKLYRRSFLSHHRLRFLENVIYIEDVAFSIQTALFADKIFWIDKPLYYYRIGVGGSRDKRQIIKRMTIFKMYKILLDGLSSLDLPQDVWDWLYTKRFRAYSHFYRQEVPASLKADARMRLLSAISNTEWERIESGQIHLPFKTRFFLYWIRGGWSNVLVKLFLKWIYTK